MMKPAKQRGTTNMAETTPVESPAASADRAGDGQNNSQRVKTTVEFFYEKFADDDETASDSNNDEGEAISPSTISPGERGESEP